MVFYLTKKLSEFLSSVFTSVPYKVKPFTFISLQGKKNFARIYIEYIFHFDSFYVVTNSRIVKTRTKTLFIKEKEQT